MSVTHCMKDEFTPREKRLTCYNCAAPLADNQLVKDAYKVNTAVVWAKGQLGKLADMADEREVCWFAAKVRYIVNKMVTLGELEVEE